MFPCGQNGHGLLKTCSFSPLSLSPLYPFHLSIPFTSLSLSPLSLSLLSLPPSLYLSFYLSFSLSPSLSYLSIILFGVSNGRFSPCLGKKSQLILFSHLFGVEEDMKSKIGGVIVHISFKTIFSLLLLTNNQHYIKLS